MEKRITREEEQFVERADSASLKGILSNCLGDAKGQQERRQQSQSFIRKAGNKTVVFANNFSSFLQAYSGIIEIMKGADQQYGGAAYATLSLFLIVRTIH